MRVMLRCLCLCSVWVAVGFGAQSTAQACSACDSEEHRTPLAWSEDGTRLAVLLHDYTVRTGAVWVEVWEIGTRVPVACYDLMRQTDVDAPMACDGSTERDEVSLNDWERYRTHHETYTNPKNARQILRRVGLHEAFTVRPQRLAQWRYRLKKRPLPSAHPYPSLPPDVELVVRIKDRKRKRMFEALRVEVDLEPTDDGYGNIMRPHVKLWQVPKHPRKLLIVVAGTSPGRTHLNWLRTRFQWVDLDGDPGTKPTMYHHERRPAPYFETEAELARALSPGDAAEQAHMVAWHRIHKAQHLAKRAQGRSP